jgi:hypothetical protein
MRAESIVLVLAATLFPVCSSHKRGTREKKKPRRRRRRRRRRE